MNVTLSLRYNSFVQAMDSDGQISTARKIAGVWQFTSRLHGDDKLVIGPLRCSYSEAIDRVLVHMGQKDPRLVQRQALEAGAEQGGRSV